MDTEQNNLNNVIGNNGHSLGHLDLGTRPHTRHALRRHASRHHITSDNNQSKLEASCTRFVLFNIGHITAKNVYDELRYVLDEGMAILWITNLLAASFGREVRNQMGERMPSFLRTLRLTLGAVREDLPHLDPDRPVRKWRVAPWQDWHDRHPNGSMLRWDAWEELGTSLTGGSARIASWNVNGFHSKRLQIQTFLKERSVVICTLQETLVSASNYPIRVMGYMTFEAQKEEGFRGHALLVNDQLHAIQIPHDDSKWMIHVRITGFKQEKVPLHIIALYLPSGGNRRSARSECWKTLESLISDMKEKDPQTRIILLGDLNEKSSRVDKRLHNQSLLVWVKPTSREDTRFPRNGLPSAIDHMLAMGEARKWPSSRKLILQ
ncbi:hypothetical protein AX17_004414 [Amanita inopinata Kibby_2008]|nr:hypothetical protein AX17_004414 [Amanita inopinata Kibby_2008]